MFPGVERQAREIITCDHFLDTPADPDLALKICERHLSDLDSALQIALRLEVWTANTARLKEVIKCDRSEPRRVWEISKPTEPSTVTFQKEMEKWFAELESRIAKSNYRCYRPAGTYGSYRYGNSGRFANSYQNCFRCVDATHLMHDCPLVGTDKRIPCIDLRRIHLRNNSKMFDLWKVGRTGLTACIWIKYRKYKLSALLDTGSDVSITGEVAKRLG